MNPLDRAREILADAEMLNSETNEALPKMTLAEARELRTVCRRARAWLRGIETLVEGT